MFLDISVKDMINSNSKKVNYNEVIITRRDIINIPRLMQYLIENHMHFNNDIRLDSFPIPTQNEIGIIFFDYYEYLINNNGKQYLNKIKFSQMFSEYEIIMGYFQRAEILAPTEIDNAIDINILTTNQLNDIIINFFNKQFRNFKSVEKDIETTGTLFDIDINANKFLKITNPNEFLVTMFDRYIRTTKGSIPFSGDFGSNLKASLQRKADGFTQKILEEEIGTFIQDLSNIYSDNFKFISLEYSSVGTIDVHVTIYITLQVNNDEPMIIKVGV
jgi:hypothetical protein